VLQLTLNCAHSHWPVHTRHELNATMSTVMADQESHAINASLLAGTAMLMQHTDHSDTPGC